jgi:hypothetical protein
LAHHPPWPKAPKAANAVIQAGLCRTELSRPLTPPQPHPGG